MNFIKLTGEQLCRSLFCNKVPGPQPKKQAPVETPCHARGHQVLFDPPGSLTGRYATQGSLTFIPREAEDFPRGDKHFKHVPPPTYLIYLSPIDLYR